MQTSTHPALLALALVPADAATAAAPTPTPAATEAPRAAPRCPCCDASARDALPIRYGMVAASVVAQARRGEVVLGPINHGRNEPQLECRRCSTRYGARRADLDRFGRPTATWQRPQGDVRLASWRRTVAA